MIEVLNRRIAGDMVKLYGYDGKLRFRVTGSYYKVPATADEIAQAKRMALTRFGDGSVTVVMQMLIDSDVTERQIERRYEELLNRMEDDLGIVEGDCSSSGWFVGSADDSFDHLMTEEERQIIRAASPKSEGQEPEQEYMKLLTKPLEDISEDIFLRADVFEDAPWYDDFTLYMRIGTCTPKTEHIENVRKALKLMGYETRILRNAKGVYLAEGAQ